MEPFSQSCPCCNGTNIHPNGRYETQNNGTRTIYHCRDCDAYFSETYDTPIARLRTPLSRIVLIFKARSEGTSLNATARTFNVSKKTILDWEWRLADLKPTPMLYSLMHKFLSQVIEGDELYTKVGENRPASDSQGWSIVLMERASRFLWELHCGPKDEKLFQQALDY
ncbi:MAG: hypothetical protein ACKO24_12325 [Leptolyngbyaceae cyanobacterium]